MQRFLDLAAEEQRVAFEQTASATGLVASSVEKDFWVCWALRELFSLPFLKDALVFKGGTSLSKVWGLIDRFSEDIDLTIDRNVLEWHPAADLETLSRKKRDKELDALRDAVREVVREKIHPALETRLLKAVAGRTATVKVDGHDGDGLTLLLYYPAVTAGSRPAYVAPVVKMEFGARSDPWPTAFRNVRSLVAENFPAQFQSPDVEVTALVALRTFIEKVLILHEETFRPATSALRHRMARHYYDVHRLIETGVADGVIADQDLFEKVVRHRAVYFRQNWVDYDGLGPGTLRLRPLPEQEPAWRKDYVAMGAEMFRNTPPPFDDLLKSVEEFERRFNALGEDSGTDPPGR